MTQYTPNKWYKTSDWNAPENEVVETKIDDKGGIRNEQTLKRVGNLWFHPDGKMYVYYTPTHFKIIA